jgi:hypothetical protein
MACVPKLARDKIFWARCIYCSQKFLFFGQPCYIIYMKAQRT